ncbi:MAG: serine/threonine-protein kinase [Myxococcaceae bacterium]
MAETAAADPLVGQVLNGRFRIIEPLGVGGMGRVYKAVQSPLDRVIALKVLNPRYAASKDPGFERRFFLEAAMTAKLKHANTITVHDYGRTDDGIFFIAMEYVEGETMQRVLQREHLLTWPRALHIAGQICRSLREAHKLGLVHRDLKPANVMLLREETDSDMVKVLDFGLVKSFMPDGPAAPTETELTQAGVLLGSPLYMAPEQAKNETDPRSDIYSLGVLLYQCIAGKPPFQGSDSIDIIVKHIREKPVPLRNHVTDLPLEVNALVMKCLEKEPANRFQSMDEVLEAMKAAGSTAGLSGAFSDPRSFAFRPPSSQAIPVQKGPTSSKNVPAVVRTRSTKSGELSKQEVATPNHTSSESVSMELSITDESERTGKPVTLIALAAAGGLLVVSMAVWLITRKPAETVPPPGHEVVVRPEHPVKPPPEQPKENSTVKPPPAPAEVVFHVVSTPPGAGVAMDGKPVGVTPLEVSVAADTDGQASAELTLSLDGYQPLTFTAVGSEARVEVKQSLKKQKAGGTAPHKVPGKKDPGYKDDPYQ